MPPDGVRRARSGSTGCHGTHALGHTRMATESRVTTEGSHPFSTGMDLCLVHNGSLSNHNRLREELRREGIDFQTENDSEVAAGYLTWRLREGATLEQALEGCLEDLDGFYTFAVGTARRLRRAARPDRLQAGGDGRDRRLGRDGLRVPRDRRAARRRRRRPSGSPSRRASTAGAARCRHERRRPTATVETVDLADQPSLRELNARLHERRHDRRATGASSTRAARHAIAVGARRAARDRDRRATSGYYCAGMNKHADGARARQRRRRPGREHDVRDGRRRRQRQPGGRRHRPRRPARRPRRRLGALRRSR